MAEEEGTVVVESKATPEAQAAAEKLGWIPPKRFKGDPERFIDADAYIERGETVLPIVKEHNKRLQGEVETLRQKTEAQEKALAEAKEAIALIEERHSVETQKAVAAARKQVKEQLAKASEDGDHEGVAELTDQLTQLNAAEKEAPKKEKPTESAPSFVPHPDLRAWNEEHEWFGTNRRLTALALGIAQELREAGEKSVGRHFYDLVAAEVEKETGRRKAEPRGDKVEGSRSSEEGTSRANGKKAYANLPADAKAACDADTNKFVGPTKRYKTQAEWRQRYADMYFEES